MGIDVIFERCQQLVETIPFVKRAAFEKSFTTERSRGFTHVARAVLANKSDLPAYHSHPSHLECLKDLKPVIEENLAVAYETRGHRTCECPEMSLDMQSQCTEPK